MAKTQFKTRFTIKSLMLCHPSSRKWTRRILTTDRRASQRWGLHIEEGNPTSMTLVRSKTGEMMIDTATGIVANLNLVIV